MKTNTYTHIHNHVLLHRLISNISDVTCIAKDKSNNKTYLVFVFSNLLCFS